MCVSFMSQERENRSFIKLRRTKVGQTKYGGVIEIGSGRGCFAKVVILLRYSLRDPFDIPNGLEKL